MGDRRGVVCAGVSCLDLMLHGTTPLATREGLSLVARTEYRPGGATSNTGRALARLGIPVEYLTLIGDDPHGEILCQLWREDGIDLSRVTRTPAAGTALSVLPVYADGKRGVYFSAGTNARMESRDLFGKHEEHLHALHEKSAFHFGYPPLTPLLQGDSLAAMLARVRETGVLVSLDTTPVANDTTLAAMLTPALPLTHLFAPNIEEASQVTGHFTRLAARAAAESARAGQACDIEDIITREELLEIGERLIALGVPLVVITLGKQGAFLCTGDENAMRSVPHSCADGSWTHLRVMIPSFQVNGPLNTTGAGDTFIAGLLAGVLAGMGSLTEIVRLAQAASALHIDSSRGLCRYDDVRALAASMTARQPENPA